uniref:Beta-defensin n=1 Tax=Sarcophilus harrisii TaxID=9305 RepID=A0A7N4PGX2_SARHA
MSSNSRVSLLSPILAPHSLCALLSSWAGGWTEKKCWNNTGCCWNQCKNTETDHFTCANKKRCCVPTDRFPKDSWESHLTPGM